MTENSKTITENSVAIAMNGAAVVDGWQISTSQKLNLLQCSDLATFEEWKAGSIASCGSENIERLSIILSIGSALEIVFSNTNNLQGWICRKNVDFNGQSPLDIMLSEGAAGMQKVQRYLRSW